MLAQLFCRLGTAFGQARDETFFACLPLQLFELEYGRAGWCFFFLRRSRRLFAHVRRRPARKVLQQLAREDRLHQTNSSPLADRLICPESASRRAIPITSFCAASTSLRRTGPFTSRSSRNMSAARCDILAKIFSRTPGSAPFNATTRRAEGTSRNKVCMLRSSSSARSSKTNISSSIRPPRLASWVRMAAISSASRLASIALRISAAALSPPTLADLSLLVLPEN